MANTRDCRACGGDGRDIRHSAIPSLSTFRPCPVCLGSGRVSDVIPAQDAVADAEILWWEIDHHWRGIISDRIGRALIQTWPSSAGKYARQAARAAFRAVPGLRG